MSAECAISIAELGDDITLTTAGQLIPFAQAGGIARFALPATPGRPRRHRVTVTGSRASRDHDLTA